MLDPLETSLRIAGSGLRAQSARLRVVTENIANVDSAGSQPGADPYSRKTISFENEFDRVAGTKLLKVRQQGIDSSPFRIEHNPGHPAADSDGNVKLPNVDMLMELADMKDANRAYQANIQCFKQSRELFAMTIDLLKGAS